MAYTYNDVQNPMGVYALDDSSSETPSGNGMDLDLWTALQKAFAPNTQAPAFDMGTDSVVSAADQAIGHISSVSQAAIRMGETQAVANIHVNSDNFIRDSITGK